MARDRPAFYYTFIFWIWITSWIDPSAHLSVLVSCLQLIGRHIFMTFGTPTYFHPITNAIKNYSNRVTISTASQLTTHFEKSLYWKVVDCIKQTSVGYFMVGRVQLCIVFLLIFYLLSTLGIIFKRHIFHFVLIYATHYTLNIFIRPLKCF